MPHLSGCSELHPSCAEPQDPLKKTLEGTHTHLWHQPRSSSCSGHSRILAQPGCPQEQRRDFPICGTRDPEALHRQLLLRN